MNYRVEADEEIFNRIIDLSLRVRRMAGFFQNDGIILTGENVAEYNDLWCLIQEEVEELQQETDKRIVLED